MGRPGEQRCEALVLLSARGAAVQVRGHSGHGGLGVGAGGLQVDVTVEFGGADVAADLGLVGTEEAAQRRGLVVDGQQLSFPAGAPVGARPWSCRWARSLRRASCRVLYSAPRVLPSRSASTSIGTPLTVRATSTRR